MPIGNPYKSKFSDALAGEELIAPPPANFASDNEEH